MAKTQLSGMDATFLYFESDQTPMHVAGLTLFEPPKDMKTSFHEHYAKFFASRVHLIPIFGKKLARTVLELDHPGWVDAGDIDFDYHIKGVTLPSPGSMNQVEELVADLHSKPLDRKKPLWQFTVIEGIENNQVALYSKVHHAAVDGGAGMVITNALYDLTEVPREVEPPKPNTQTERVPTIAERSILGLHDLTANVIRQQLKVMEAVPQLMGQGVELVEKIAGLSAPDGSSDGTPTQLLAPRTPFNVTLGRKRTYAARTVALSDAKMIAKATGAKINDIVMATCSGALRSYLLQKKKLPDAPLVAFVPVSLREAGNTDINNQVFGMNCPLATHIEDPLKRLERIVKDSGGLKSAVGSVKKMAPTDFTLLGAPLLLPGLMKLYGRTKLAEVIPQVVNVAISNTAGPPFPLYAAGAKVTALYPVSIATHGVGLNFTVQSYMDGLDFGLTAGEKAVPDLDIMGDMLVDAFEELKSAALALGDTKTTSAKTGTEPKTAAKKSSAKKTVAKKSATKKPVARKASTKKSAAGS